MRGQSLGRVASRQTPYSFSGPKEYAEKSLHLAVGMSCVVLLQIN